MTASRPSTATAEGRAMFPLSPVVAQMFVRERIAEDHRQAERRRRVAEAVVARPRRRGLLTPLGSAAGQQPDTTGTRIVDTDPSQQGAMVAFLRGLSQLTSYGRFVSSTPAAELVDVRNMLAA